MRQVVLDTETTGLEPSEGHRVIEIGAVELIDRSLSGKHFHSYLNPQRDIEDGALEVHGITQEFLHDKPLFADVAEDFLQFIKGAELVIHNAPFDLGFLDMELSQLAECPGRIEDFATVLDTLEMARELHPGQRNNLDALCKRYEVDNSNRELHGALLDSEILADVYLAMTGGQTALLLDEESANSATGEQQIRRLDANRPPLRVIAANADELAAHEAYLDLVEKAHGGPCLWRREPEA